MKTVGSRKIRLNRFAIQWHIIHFELFKMLGLHITSHGYSQTHFVEALSFFMFSVNSSTFDELHSSSWSTLNDCF